MPRPHTRSPRLTLASLAAAAWLAAAPPAAGQQNDPKPPSEGTYELSAVEVLPQLRNRDEIARAIAERYPRALLDSAVTGDVLLRFRVLRDGTVDPASVLVERATNDAFAEAAMAVARRMQFAPAKLGGRPVVVWVTVPIRFGIERPAPAREDFSGTGGRAPAASPQNGSNPSPADSAYELSAVEELPHLLNNAEIARALADLYPRALRDSAVAGDVLVRFRLLRNGTVDSASVTVEEATRAEFAEVATIVVREMRFRPAKVGGQPVVVWITLPIRFTAAPPAPAREDFSGTGRRAPAASPRNRANPPPADSTYELSAVEVLPQLRNLAEIRRETAARYPPGLQAARVEGQVSLRFRILTNGTVDSASVTVEQATDTAFTEAATAVARRMQFAPARVAGRPVAVWVTLPVAFSLVAEENSTATEKTPRPRIELPPPGGPGNPIDRRR